MPAGTIGDWAFLDLGNVRGAISKVALLCDNVSWQQVPMSEGQNILEQLASKVQV